jgi:hypothetical protein
MEDTRSVIEFAFEIKSNSLYHYKEMLNKLDFWCLFLRLGTVHVYERGNCLYKNKL